MLNYIFKDTIDTAIFIVIPNILKIRIQMWSNDSENFEFKINRFWDRKHLLLELKRLVYS